MYTDRRQFLKTAGGLTLGIITVSSVGGLLAACSSSPGENAAMIANPGDSLGPAAIPWPYQTIDPVKAAERAYTAYYNGGCMYGAFEGIIGELRDSVGAPYNTFPAEMMKYGGAGVAGWGTLCGTCNGAAAAITLVNPTDTRNNVISDLFSWYGEESLPDYKPAEPKFENIPASVANSQLCHISVSRWCVSSGYTATSPERAERCAWLTASTAKKTAELLNASLGGTFTAAYAVPASVTGCLSCHGKDGLGNVHNTKQTTCTNCHTDFTHPVPLN